MYGLRLSESQLRFLVWSTLREKHLRGELVRDRYLAAAFAALELLEMDLNEAAHYARFFGSHG